MDTEQRSPLRLRHDLRRAAQRGLTLAEFDALVAAETARLIRIHELTYNRALQFDVIAAYAHQHGRAFTAWEV